MITTTPSRLGKQSKSRRSRRGGTLVVVAIMFTVLMGISAMALDFSRMYEFRAQIKTLADAAAMSAILDRKGGLTETQAENNAFGLIPVNRVEGSGAATMAAGDVTPVTWHPSTRTANDTPWTLANAVKVSVNYTSNYTLARVFGATSKTLNDTTVALFGSLVTSSCMAPIAMPYASILQKLGRDPTVLSYNLTEADIATLKSPSAELQFMGLGANAAPEASAPGNFGWVDTNSESGHSNAQIAAALLGCTSGNSGTGDDLSGVPGARNANDVRDAVETRCGGPSTCNMSYPPILIAIYDSGTGTGGTATFHVKYIGAFKFTRWDFHAGDIELYGYLTATDVAPTGEVIPMPGPATVRPQIVK